jgi:Nnf1
MKQNIDDLHAVVLEARVRKQTREIRQDIWKQDLHPRAAARARTVPLLEDARNKLLAELNQVSS